MKTLKNNESGFSAVEVILVIIIVALLGIVGWFVYKNQNKTTTPSTTANTTTSTPTETTTTTNAKYITVLTSRNNKFSIGIPDGWTVTNDTESDYIHAIGIENMSYDAGNPAKIIDAFGHRGGGPTVASFILQFSNTSGLNGYFSASESQGAFTTTNGAKGEKYLYTAKQNADEMLVVGSKSYGYKFDYEDKTIVITYLKLPSDVDQLQIVEDAIKTLKFI